MSGRENATAAETIPGYAKMLDDLTAMFDAVVPCPIFASSILFPSDGGWHFTEGKQEYFCGSPTFWKTLPAAHSDVYAPGYSMPLGSIPIVDVDDAANQATREQVMAALLRRLDPLPPKAPTHAD